MTTQNPTRRGQLGFTIIEALISLMIMGFGILSLAGMQQSLSRNADDAKQRTEAVRLAQEKIESFRSYTGIASTVVGQGTISTTALNWNALAGGADSITTNAVYARTWTLGGSAADPMRGLTVGVGWTDRAGAGQAVSLSSVLSKSDPADSGFLGFPLPQNTNLKRPKNRNLDIPIPAIDLGTGESAVPFGTGGQYVLFGNISGDVVKICTPTLSGTPTNADIIAALTSTVSGTSNCTQTAGYIVAGYVERQGSVPDAVWNGLGINYSGITRNAAGATGISCQFGNAVNQNTGTAIANYKYYMCVIPLAAPTTALTTNGPYNWSGKILLAGPSAWQASANKYFVCRYEYAATNSLTDVNQRNVQPYVAVNKSIDQQNYVVSMTANATSTASPTCPSTMTVANLSAGVLHQDCRSASNANYATACPLLGALTTYTISYNGNGNTGGTAPTDASSPYTTGSTVTVLGNTGTLTKTGGYTFGGWNTLAGGTGTAYAAGAPLTIAANTTLYAQWSTLPTYTVTYNGNGSTGGTAPTDANSPYTSGNAITILDNTGALAKSGGYTFSGWNKLADGTGTAYAAGSTLTIAANTLLYAQWSVLPTYTVTYYGNANTGGATPSNPNSSYVSGATVTVLGNSGGLSKTGYAFNGWNTAANGTGTFRAIAATFSITSNAALYAQWLQIQLGTPAPTWSPSGTPKTLSWTGVNGATAYSVSGCSVINNASTTSCSPASPTSQAGTSVTPPALGTKDTWCYSVMATGSPYANSTASATKCVNRAANGNYSYQ